MTAAEIARALEPWLAKHRRPAWKPVTEAGDGEPTVSKFGGTAWTGPGAEWPVCRCCGGPMPLFVQLDLGKLPADLGGRFGDGLLQLFYCTGDCDGEGWRPFSDEVSCCRVVHSTGDSAPVPDGVELLPAKRIVGWERFQDRPDPTEWEDYGLLETFGPGTHATHVECPELGLAFRNVPSDLFETLGPRPGDKLAGWPFWVQGVEYPDCPECGRQMELLLQVDSEDNVPFMFGDAGCGHVTQCPTHRDIVAFGWACG